MARKTKAEAEHTRRQIIEAARRVFAERGVSRTTLEQIAAAAGVSRGAIYWHFANKTDLFFAMRDEVCLQLTDRIDESLLAENVEDPLQAIETALAEMLEALAKDEATRQTFEIMSLKCEYVDEFQVVMTQIMQPGREFMRKLEGVYSRALDKGLLREGAAPSLLAVDTYIFMSGLMRLWFVDIDGVSVRKRARELIRAHVASRRKTDGGSRARC